MPTFANPPGYSAETAEAYVAALLDLLGDQDPMDILAATPDVLRGLTQGLSELAVRLPEAPAKWSIVEVVQHLADSELVYGYRMRLIVAEATPPIPGYDQNAWATNLRYAEVNLIDALADFESLRRMNLRWLQNLTKDERSRSGLHSERGEESVAHIIRLLGAHDLVHRNQVARIKAMRNRDGG